MFESETTSIPMATTTAILSIETFEKDGEKNIVNITNTMIKINIFIMCFINMFLLILIIFVNL